MCEEFVGKKTLRSKVMLVVRNGQGDLLLAVDDGGFGPGLKAGDVPELVLSRGQVFARTMVIGGVVEQSEIVFQGDNVVSVRPDVRSSVQINKQPYVVGAGSGFRDCPNPL